MQGMRKCDPMRSLCSMLLRFLLKAELHMTRPLSRYLSS